MLIVNYTILSSGHHTIHYIQIYVEVENCLLTFGFAILYLPLWT